MPLGSGNTLWSLLFNSVVVFTRIGWLLYNKRQFCLWCRLNVFFYICCSEISLWQING